MNRGIATMHRIGAFFLAPSTQCLKQNKRTEFERFIAIVYVFTLAL